MFKPDFSVKTYAEGKINSGMIDVNKLPEFPGFTVYDAKTGEPLTAKDIDPNLSKNDWLVADEEGLLIIPYYPEKYNSSCFEVPRRGEYIVQMGTGEMYRW